MIASDRGSISVLHVEDDSGFADFTAMMLERAHEDIDVETVPSANEGLERVSEGPDRIDCIVRVKGLYQIPTILLQYLIQKYYPERREQSADVNRREFLAASGGGGALMLAGVGAALGDASLNDGPAYGPVTTPPGSGSRTLANGVTATLYEDGTIAFLGASLVTDSEGGTAVAGQVQNISESAIRQVRIKVQFRTDTDAILAQGWVTVDDLESGGTWEFVVPYPADDPDRIAVAAIAAIERS